LAFREFELSFRQLPERQMELLEWFRQLLLSSRQLPEAFRQLILSSKEFVPSFPQLPERLKELPEAFRQSPERQSQLMKCLEQFNYLPLRHENGGEGWGEVVKSLTLALSHPMGEGIWARGFCPARSRQFFWHS
jgi:hypothetical protein